MENAIESKCKPLEIMIRCQKPKYCAKEEDLPLENRQLFKLLKIDNVSSAVTSRLLVSDNVTLSKCSNELIETLEIKLNPPAIGSMRNWEHLASVFGLQNDLIVSMRQKKSPIKEFFRRCSNKKFNELANSNVHDPEKYEMETDKLMPTVSGMRVENYKNEGFLDYTAAGLSIVEPDVKVKILIFGFWLDRVDLVSFTTDNCYHPLINISVTEFTFQNELRIEFPAQFADDEDAYRICLKEKNFGQADYDPDDRILIDEQRTWISTNTAPVDHIMPEEIQIVVIFFLFLLSALFSGLNLGLMALTPQDLMLLQQSGSDLEKKYATIILPVRKKGNSLLCTILIMNVIVNSAISILFEDLTSGPIAFCVSSIGIVVFGEILPQSLCIKKGLAVGAATIYLTKFFMILTCPLSYPIGAALDWLLGEEVLVYDRNRLLQIMKLTPVFMGFSEEMAEDLKIAVGAMEICDKIVKDVMTNIDDVFMLSENTELNTFNISEILKHGYTRIPVYRGSTPTDIISLLFVKDLALIDPEDAFKTKILSEYHQHQLRFVPETTTLHEMLSEFKNGDYHLAIVYKPDNETDKYIMPGFRRESDYDDSFSRTSKFDKSVEMKNMTPLLDKSSNPKSSQRTIVGIVSLEDIVEEILQAEIIDESDMIMDNVYKTKRKTDKKFNYFKMFEYEEKVKNPSIAVCAVTSNFLATNFPIFSEKYVDPRALYRLISKNIHLIRLHKTIAIDNIQDYRKQFVSIVKAGEPCDKIVLILEGTGTVTMIGSDETFTVGPFEYFGHVLLDKLEKAVQEEEQLISKTVSQMQFIPDYTLDVTKFCKYLLITPIQYTNIYKVTKATRTIKENDIVLDSLKPTSETILERRMTIR
uniref:CNNM transmembrane domain-containing protein n=1 Tax=Rhabditophanes sp. KR3021 TaxID=114890 RepID=A0AC35U6A5_9BILA